MTTNLIEAGWLSGDQVVSDTQIQGMLPGLAVSLDGDQPGYITGTSSHGAASISRRCCCASSRSASSRRNATTCYINER